MEAIFEKEHAGALELLKHGKKDQAMLTLRKKKYQEGMLERAEQHLVNLEEMVRQDLSPTGCFSFFHVSTVCTASNH